MTGPIKHSFLALGFTVVLIASTDEVLASIQFFTSKAAFDAVATTTTIDFEGIVSDGSFTIDSPSITVDGIVFSVPSSYGIGVAGKNSGVNGAPYDSAVLFSNNARPITAHLPAGTTAVGGFFGDINSAGTPTLMTVAGPSGVLASQTLTTADMGLGTPSNFFGWIATGGDTILSVTHNLQGQYAGIDDFQYGTVTVNAVPEATSILAWTMVLGGIGLIAYRRQLIRGTPAV